MQRVASWVRRGSIVDNNIRLDFSNGTDTIFSSGLLRCRFLLRDEAGQC
jgi:hypothetical protein